MIYARDKQFGAIIQVSDIAANGEIPLAANAIDTAGILALSQATASISVTLPIPSSAETKHIIVLNSGSTPISVNGHTITNGDKLQFTFFSGAWY